MDIWKIIESIEKGVSLEDYSGFEPRVINSFLSFDPRVIPICDRLNLYTDLPKDLVYKLFVVFFKDLRLKFSFSKKKSIKLDQDKIKIAKLYRWSQRELSKNWILFSKISKEDIERKIGNKIDKITIWRPRI
jgi:hypothetical protein